MNAQAVRKPPRFQHRGGRRIQSSASEQCAKGCAFPDVQLDCIKYLKLGEQTAQAILDARALYPDASLADLYDERSMPPELRKAHQANDKAVMDAYGIKKGDPAWQSESACVALLMKLYQALSAQDG